MKHTQQAAKIDKLNFLVAAIISDLNNEKISSAIKTVNSAKLTSEQFGFLVRNAETITKRQVSVFIKYVTFFQLTNK